MAVIFKPYLESSNNCVSIYIHVYTCTCMVKCVDSICKKEVFMVKKPWLNEKFLKKCICENLKLFVHVFEVEQLWLISLILRNSILRKSARGCTCIFYLE